MKIRNIESSFVWLHRGIDLFIPSITLYFITVTYGLEWISRYQNTGVWTGLFLIAFGQFNGLYHNWRGRSLYQDSSIVIKSWVFVCALVILLIFMFKISEQFSRFVLITWFVISPFILILYRFFIRQFLASLYKKNHFTKSAAIYGSGQSSTHIITVLNKNKWLGYRIENIFDDFPTNDNNIEISGGTDELISLAKSGKIQTVFIALPMERNNEIKHLLNGLSDTTVIIKYIPDFFSFDLLNASMTTIGGTPVINICDTPLNDPAKVFIKRLEDISISTLILLLILPIMIVIAIGIKLSSPGPIFYKQSRVGWNGKKFNMLKFRSMAVDTEKDGIQWGGAKNKTTSRFGSFIRKTSLDELPQFINVLKGEMSIVGPRPERDVFVKQFRQEIPRYMQKHIVKAGITGWAQINGWRGDTDLNKRIEYDLYYIDSWSLWLDIKIIILTVLTGLSNKNAY